MNKYQALLIATFIMLSADCKSDANIFESTIDVSFGTVYFGTSSNRFYVVDNEFEAVQFARVNWSRLTAEMACGEGEHLTTIADLLNVKPAMKGAFYNMTKVKFSQLFPTAETSPEQLLKNLKVEIGKLDET